MHWCSNISSVLQCTQHLTKQTEGSCWHSLTSLSLLSLFLSLSPSNLAPFSPKKLDYEIQRDKRQLLCIQIAATQLSTHCPHLLCCVQGEAGTRERPPLPLCGPQVFLLPHARSDPLHPLQRCSISLPWENRSPLFPFGTAFLLTMVLCDSSDLLQADSLFLRTSSLLL